MTFKAKLTIPNPLPLPAFTPEAKMAKLMFVCIEQDFVRDCRCLMAASWFRVENWDFRIFGEDT